MKPIPLTYVKNGYHYSQIKRDSDVVIYQQSEPVTNRVIAYEVFRIVKQKGKKAFGQLLEDKELPPGNESFGKTAFACSTFEQALNRYNQLINSPCFGTSKIERSPQTGIKP